MPVGFFNFAHKITHMQNRKAQLSGTGFDALKIVPADELEPGAGEVLINIKAASLNFLDLMVLRGDFVTGLPYPFIPLSDGAGVVAAVGAGVTQWKAGDRFVLQYVQNWLTGEAIPL